MMGTNGRNWNEKRHIFKGVTRKMKVILKSQIIFFLLISCKVIPKGRHRWITRVSNSVCNITK